MPPTRKSLDVAALQALSEPLTVRVERVNGSQREPIPLPDSPLLDYSVDDPPQTTTVANGWSIDNVRALESWLLQWTGGGFYTVSVNDGSGSPPLEWSFNYSTRTHPPRPAPSITLGSHQVQPIMPPASAIAHAQAQGIPLQQGPNGGIQVVTMSDPQALNGGLPFASSYQQQQPPQQPVYPGYYPTQVPMYPPTPIQRYTLPPNASMDQRLEAENRMMRDRLEAEQRASMAAHTQMQLREVEARHRDEARQRDAQHEKEMIALREQIAAAARPRESDLVHTIEAKLESVVAKLVEVLRPRDDGGKAEMQRMLDEQNRRHEAELNRLRQDAHDRDQTAQRERDRIDAERREEKIRSEIKDNQIRMEALITKMTESQKDRGPDPIITIMQQNMQMQVDAMKHVSSQQSLSMQQLAQFMLPPTTVMSMVREASNGQDGMIRGLAGAYGEVMGMMQTAMQTIMSMQPQGSGNPIVETIQNVVQKASDTADKWIQGQNAQVIARAQTERTAIQAQSDVLQAQANASRPIVVQPGTAQLPPAPEIATAAPSAQAPSAPTTDTGHPSGAIKRLGHTDEEWFGPTLPDVIRLRDGAAAFVESTSVQPMRRDDKGLIVGVSPGQAAAYLTSAAAEIVKAKVNIPAFSKLFMDGRYADLVDVLLPDVIQDYRDLCVQFLTRQLDPNKEAELFSDEVEEAVGKGTVVAPPPAPPTPAPVRAPVPRASTSPKPPKAAA